MKEIALNSPEIEYCGRIDDRDPLHPQFIFPATYLKFRFVGSFASLKIKNLASRLEQLAQLCGCQS